jgi:hypothetical protein
MSRRSHQTTRNINGQWKFWYASAPKLGVPGLLLLDRQGNSVSVPTSVGPSRGQRFRPDAKSSWLMSMTRSELNPPMDGNLCSSTACGSTGWHGNL